MAELSLVYSFILGLSIGSFIAVNMYISSRGLLSIKNTTPKNITSTRKEIWSRNNDLLFDRVRIFCWVMTQPKSHKTKAQYSKYTWTRHCNHLMYISEEADKSLPATQVKSNSSRKGLWDKVKNAFRLIEKNYKGKYDWVLKADDDSYVDMMALRRVLLPFNGNDPLFLGETLVLPWYRYELYLPQGFITGGGGYVLSKEAVKRFVAVLNDNRSDEQLECKRGGLSSEEDPRISECLTSANVITIDTRDHDGFSTFSQFSAEEKLITNRFMSETFWYWVFQPWESAKDGIAGCCTNKLVSLHYVVPYNMFVYQYLIDKVNPFDTRPAVRKREIDWINYELNNN